MQATQEVRILRATAGADMPEIGMKAGDTFYLARDEQASNGPNTRFRAVKWDVVRLSWRCSCGRVSCPHKILVNDFLTEEFKQKYPPGDDLAAHVEDDLRSNRL